jgi:hypothetical protein
VTSNRLENLVRTGALKEEPARAEELDGLKQSGMRRLHDARREDLSFDSRFDLTYNAAHALALYALRQKSYRAGNRYLVFQLLGETAALEAGHWRVLAKAHEHRNLAEYEGHLEPDEQLLSDMLAATARLADGLFPDDQ